MADGPSIALEPSLNLGQPDQASNFPPIVGNAPGTVTSTPLTQREVATSLLGRRANQLVGIPSFQERNIQTGIPLDTETGIPTMERLSLDFKREPDQKNFLERVYGQGNVRKADTGDWIVRYPDPETGKPVDHAVNPQSMDVGDTMGLVPLAKDMALWYLGGAALKALPILGKAKGLFGAVRSVLGGAAAVEGAGAGTDVTSRLIEGTPVNFPEIARSRGAMALFDAGLGGAGELAGGIMRWMRNPYAGSRTSIQLDAQAARDSLAGKYGVYVDLTPGELTGSPVLARKESYLEKVPGSSAVYQKMLADRNANMERLSNTMQGTELPPDDVLGNQAINALQTRVAPTENALAAAKQSLADSALSEINQTVANSTLQEGRFTRAYVGDAIRNKVNALRDSAKAEVDALYAKVRALGGTDPLFSADELSQDAQKMYDSLPPKFKTNIQQSDEGVLPFAQFKSETISREPTTAFASETHILSKLKELMAAKGQHFSLSDLQQMRREVYDDMAKGEALPGLSTHYLSDIGGMITKAIEDGVEAMPSGELKSAYQQANQAYKDKLLPFNQKGIAEVFNPISEKSHVGPAELASRLTSGPSGADKFNTLKGLLGSDSMEINMLRRQMADEVVSAGLEPGENLINPQKMISSLQRFKDSNLDLYNEVFGKTGDKIMSEAKLAGALDSDKVPADVIEGMLRGTSPTTGKLKDAIAAQRELNTTYRNSILNGIRTGKFDATAIRPSEFVSRMMDNATPSEISEVMGKLADRPALVEDIRSSAMQKVLADSRDSGKTVSEILQRAEKDKSVKAILGNGMFEDLKKFGVLQTGIEFKKTMGEMAGSFASGRIVGSLNILNPFSVPPYLAGFAKEFVAARILTSKPLMNWVSKVPSSEPSAMYVALSSAPFTKYVLDTFGADKARSFMASLKYSMDSTVGKNAVDNSQTNAAPATSASGLEPPLNLSK